MNEDFVDETVPEPVPELVQPTAEQLTRNFDETLGAAYFDAAVTASRERVTGVYVEEAAPEANEPGNSRDGGPSVWGY